MVKADAFNKAGMFDPNTFLYSEEPILAEKMLAVGYRNYFFAGSHVIHGHGGATSDYFAWKRGMQISFKSDIYYFKNYKKVNCLTLWLTAVANFWYLSVCLELAKRIKEWSKQ